MITASSDTKYIRKHIRKRALQTICAILNDKPIRYGWDDDNNDIGNGNKITASVKTLDLSNINPKFLPYLSITPAPHTINVGLLGIMKDSNYRVAIQGLVAKSSLEETLFDASEDVLQVIIELLTTEANVQEMFKAGFSIIEIGPILNEQLDESENIAYISAPVAIQFVED